MSFKTEIDTGETRWSSNAVRLRTRKEADAAGRELSWRWMAVRAWRVAPSKDPVNYRFDFKLNHLVAV